MDYKGWNVWDGVAGDGIAWDGLQGMECMGWVV